ncbi:ornithine carbamoyltransferase [Kroppenstedtia guangzhouensis]|uniref:ornithine carbamoyltransferase n=1 Tax=Kroppenstedtia guangzhouensis TaxID=1274356 RepID=UPI001666C4E7|nr:ornithine carbamoyltransferase [Kroppenstedtia guangzhouensis]
MNLRNRDFLSLKDFKKEELETLLELGLEMKRGLDHKEYLSKKTLGLLFSVPSTRTRISFQVAARQLGAHAEYFSNTSLQLANKESIRDTASVMSRYLDAIIVRWYDMRDYGMGRRTLEKLAEYADCPVINALDDKDHPCQVLADLMTLKEVYGESYKEKKIVFTWGYAERKKSPGVTHSLLTAAAQLGMNLRIAHPKGFELDEEYTSFASQAVKSSGGTIEYCHDLEEALEGADVVYAKTWGSLTLPVEEENRLKLDIRDEWCVTKERFKLANEGAYFMNCLPIIRGDEATADVIDSKQSLIYEESENRLHIQKAILTSLL